MLRLRMGGESVAKVELEPRLLSPALLALIPLMSMGTGSALAPSDVSKCPMTPTEKEQYFSDRQCAVHRLLGW